MLRQFMMRIRPGDPGEHQLLTDLAFRSVRYWDYPEEFFDWEPDSIVVPPSFVAGPRAYSWVLEEDGRVVGFYTLRRHRGEGRIELSRMFVEPDRIGSGIGRRLWEHAVATACDMGVEVIEIDAEPHAEGFYQRMGAVTVGDHDLRAPMLPEWRLKVMEYRVRS
jgi:GNAT superfamily N-acetyltransferase